jgi:hypothetical protein
LDFLRWRALQRNYLQTFEESDGTVKKTYCTRPLFIRRGGGFMKPPRYDCCKLSGGRVSTPTFRGWCFLPEFGILFMDTDRRSQPASPRG